MNMASGSDGSSLLGESFRWFGPEDPVPLSYIRHTGAEGVFSSLHGIPPGEVWPVGAIRERRALIESSGLVWSAVESLPVHEDLKRGAGDLKGLLGNYASSLENLASQGITTVVYNFMPVLDWIRTDMRHPLPDGTECMLYDPAKFAAFEVHALRRAGAARDYTPEQLDRGTRWWEGLDPAAREDFIRNIIDVFPGVKRGLVLDDIRSLISLYDGIGDRELFSNLRRFLEATVPKAEALGIRLAIHPDDPPFPVLGLPRIVSRQHQIEAILLAVDSPANGLCFCTGSLSADPANDIPGMIRKFAGRIHAVHLRNTRRLPDGSFFESDHLAGSVDMAEAMQLLLDEQERRRSEGRRDWRLSFRPDHGHTMMDDLGKENILTPGYSAIGRMRGLAELRGLMHGLRHARLTPR